MLEESTVPDLYDLAFMPGAFRCPKCGFQLSKQTICANSGRIGVSEKNRETEECPNDGTMMVHVTYKEQVHAYSERLTEEFKRFDAHTAAVGEFLSELYGIMVDPLADGQITTVEMMTALRQSALKSREAETK